MRVDGASRWRHDLAVDEKKNDETSTYYAAQEHSHAFGYNFSWPYLRLRNCSSGALRAQKIIGRHSAFGSLFDLPNIRAGRAAFATQPPADGCAPDTNRGAETLLGEFLFGQEVR